MEPVGSIGRARKPADEVHWSHGEATERLGNRESIQRSNQSQWRSPFYISAVALCEGGSTLNFLSPPSGYALPPPGYSAVLLRFRLHPFLGAELLISLMFPFAADVNNA